VRIDPDAVGATPAVARLPSDEDDPEMVEGVEVTLPEAWAAEVSVFPAPPMSRTLSLTRGHVRQTARLVIRVTPRKMIQMEDCGRRLASG